MVNIHISGIRIFIYNEELSNYMLFIQLFFVKDYKTLFDYIKLLRDIYLHLLRGYKYKFDFLLCTETEDGEDEFIWVEQSNESFVQFLCIINKKEEEDKKEEDKKEEDKKEEEEDNVEEKYTKENLKGKKKNELLEIASKLNIERWKNKHIKYNNISDIIDAISSACV